MTRASRMRPGIHTLLARHSDWLRGRRLALLSHPAAVDTTGRHTAERLQNHPGLTLRTLMGPEHGFTGSAAAGSAVASETHPIWRLPVISLYGPAPRPPPTLWKTIDTVVVDLQDIGVRCYTYISTLRYLLEAAAAAGKTVIVADRPIPFARVIDGPPLDSRFESFVGAVHTPFVHGLTPGETALWIKQYYGLEVDLRIARMTGYKREPQRGPDWPPWIPPSPGIATWESAWCYPATVFTEAVAGVDCDRPGRLPFQLIGAEWIRPLELRDWLSSQDLPGAAFSVHPMPSLAAHKRACGHGVRLTVTHASRFKPVAVGVAILAGLRDLYGARRLWRAGGRPDFFDQLYGTDQVRRMLLQGAGHADIVDTWKSGLRTFQRSRAGVLLYATT